MSVIVNGGVDNNSQAYLEVVNKLKEKFDNKLSEKDETIKNLAQEIMKLKQKNFSLEESNEELTILNGKLISSEGNIRVVCEKQINKMDKRYRGLIEKKEKEIKKIDDQYVQNKDKFFEIEKKRGQKENLTLIIETLMKQVSMDSKFGEYEEELNNKKKEVKELNNKVFECIENDRKIKDNLSKFLEENFGTSCLRDLRDDLKTLTEKNGRLSGDNYKKSENIRFLVKQMETLQEEVDGLRELILKNKNDSEKRICNLNGEMKKEKKDREEDVQLFSVMNKALIKIVEKK